MADEWEQYAVKEAPPTQNTQAVATQEPVTDEWEQYASSSEDTGGFTESSFPEVSPVDSVINPIQYYGQSIIKGVAEGAAGINSGLAGVTRLLDSPIYDTKTLAQSYAANAQLMKKVAQEAEQMGGNNWTLNTVASLPFGMAEGGSAMNPISIVAAGGVVSALKDYGDAIAKDPTAEFNAANFQKGVEGAALTAGAIGAFTVAGATLENIANLVRKHGASTIRNMFTAINGGDERMGQKALDILSDPNYNKRAKLADVKTTAEENKALLAGEESKTAEMVSKTRKEMSDALYQRDRDFDFGVRQVSDDIKATTNLKLSKADADIQELANVRELSLQRLGMDNKDEIAKASVNVDNAIKNAQTSTQEHLDAVFTGMYKKIEQLKQKTGKAVGDTWDALITNHPQEGVSADKIWERIRTADAGENLFTFMRKDGAVKVKPHKSTPELNGIAKQMEMEINASFNEGGIATGNILKITHDIFDAASNMPADKGALLPGVGKIYGNLAEAFHVKNYADSFSPSARMYVDDIKSLNQKYGEYKNKLADTYGLYFKKEGEAIVPKTDQIFGRFDRGDVRYIERLRKFDADLAPEDRVFSQVKKAYDNFQAIRSTQEKAHIAFKGRLDRVINQETKAFNLSIANLKANRANLSATETKALSDTIFAIKQTNDTFNRNIKTAFENKIQALQKSRAESLKNLTNQLADEQLTLETQHMLRSLRPRAGLANIIQNIGFYGTVGGGAGLLTGYLAPARAVPMIIGKGLLAVAASPRIMANTSRWALQNKQAIKAAMKMSEKTGKAMQSPLLNRLLATQTTKGN